MTALALSELSTAECRDMTRGEYHAARRAAHTAWAGVQRDPYADFPSTELMWAERRARDADSRVPKAHNQTQSLSANRTANRRKYIVRKLDERRRHRNTLPFAAAMDTQDIRLALTTDPVTVGAVVLP